MDLIEFLRARLDDDEVDANALAHELGKWLHEFEVNGMDKSEGSYIAYMLVRGHASNPARVLAEVEAKRAILDLRDDWREILHNRQVPEGQPRPAETQVAQARYEAYTEVIALLIQPYAEHPDFDPAWLSL